MVWDNRIDEKLRNIDAYNGGKEEGIEEGMQKGIEANRKEMILMMHKQNISSDVIAKCANLKVADVNSIINSAI